MACSIGCQELSRKLMIGWIRVSAKFALKDLHAVCGFFRLDNFAGNGDFRSGLHQLDEIFGTAGLGIWHPRGIRYDYRTIDGSITCHRGTCYQVKTDRPVAM